MSAFFRYLYYFVFSLAVFYTFFGLIYLLLSPEDQVDFRLHPLIPLLVVGSCGLLVGFMSRYIVDHFEIESQKMPIDKRLFVRARRLEQEATIILFFIIILTVGGALVFFKASSFAHDDFNQINMDVGGEGALHEMLLILMIRVGVVGISSYLLYIFYSLYKYNLRLCAFYLSRSDAIILAREHKILPKRFEVIPVLMDANLDLGRHQPSLAQSFTDLIRAMFPKGVTEESTKE